MKFKSVSIVASLALTAFFISCKKADNQGGGTIKGSCKISAVTGYYTSPLSISYDLSGRIDTMITVGFLRTYKYEPNQITILTEKNKRFDSRIVLKYNTDTKNLDTAFITNKNGSYETKVYVYQNNHTAAEYIYYSNTNRTDTINYIWSGGNMTNTAPSMAISNNQRISYHTQLAFQEGDFNYISALIEKGYVPVGKTANLVQANFSGNINYKFNGNGYIKQVSSVHDGYPTVSYTYEYTCK